MDLLIKGWTKDNWEELIVWARIGANNCMIGEGAEVIELLPHGRLIDADELIAKQQEDADLFINPYTLMEKSRRDEALNAVANIVNAPTILEAEESET